MTARRCASLTTCLLVLLSMLLPVSCGEEQSGLSGQPVAVKGLTFTERVPLQYADQFAIDRYEGGYSLIQVADGEKYLLIPENGSVPEGLDESYRIIHKPADNIYLAATAAMSLFDALDCGDRIRFSGTKPEDWYIPYAREAMERGDMLYAGKYREPDYELLISEGCRLSVQSTMIGHNPEVREKLTELGITVFVDHSSYEAHPLGRCEWIKVYGEMTDCRESAQALFEKQAAFLREVGEKSAMGRTVAFFYISSSGQAVTRRSGDYVNRMITLAGGENIFKQTDGDSGGTSTVQMEMEQFYATAKDADIILYNNNIGRDVESLDDLIAKNRFLADFKAVKKGDVWCTGQNLFQETMKTGEIISDFHVVFSGEYKENPPKYLTRLKKGGGQA